MGSLSHFKSSIKGHNTVSYNWAEIRITHSLLQMDRNQNCRTFEMCSTRFYLSSKQVSEKVNAAEDNSSVTVGNGWKCSSILRVDMQVLASLHTRALIPGHSK